MPAGAQQNPHLIRPEDRECKHAMGQARRTDRFVNRRERAKRVILPGAILDPSRGLSYCAPLLVTKEKNYSGL